MIDVSSKKVQLAVRFFTYGVMAVATIVLTILAIYYAMGYRLSQGGLVEHGGIMEFRSDPSGAVVSIDGSATDKQTPSRAYVGPGSHTVRMQLSDYRVWQKQITLQPGRLLWLDYVRFIPQTITTIPVREFATLTSALPSPDNRWLFLQEKSDMQTFLLADLSSEVTFTALTLPESQITKNDGKVGTFMPLEWSHDSRYILLRHNLGNINEVLRIDRAKPEESINMTKQFGLTLSDVHFAGNNAGVVYAKVGQDLRRLDIPGNVVSPNFIAGVTQFSVFEDRIAFVATLQDGTQNVGVYQDNKETIVANAPADSQVLVALTEYFRDEYVAYSLGDGNVTIVRDPTGSPQNLAFAATNPKWLQFSPKGRFAIVGNGQDLAGYDLEVSSDYTGTLPTSRPPQWLDPFHIWTDQADQLRLHEFDGQNTNQITGVTSGFVAVLTPNEKSIISVGKNASGTFNLQTSRIVN